MGEDECRPLGALCRVLGEDVDGELAVDEVVVVGDDEEKSDCEYDRSCSSRKRAASRSVPNIFVAMVTETHGVSTRTH